MGIYLLHLFICFVFFFLFFFVLFFWGGGGLLKFQIFLGVLDIPNSFYEGVNSRCWVLAYV